MFWRKNQEETMAFLEKVKSHAPFVVYDLETTGKKSTVDYIVQFSANRYEVGKSGVYELVNSIDLYIKPPIIMSQEVMDIHGITNEFLANKPTESEVFPQIQSFLSGDAIITGYNIRKFDNKFMEELYKRQGLVFEHEARTIDIYTMAKENVFPKYVKDFSLKLQNVVEYFGINKEIQFHSAAEDIMATWLCGIAMIRLNRKCFSGNWNDRAEPQIISMNHYKKSSSVNRIYVTLYSNKTGNAKLYYDIPHSGWVDEEGEIILQVNMPQLEALAEKIAVERGFADLRHFTGNYSLKQKERSAS